VALRNLSSLTMTIASLDSYDRLWLRYSVHTLEQVGGYSLARPSIAITFVFSGKVPHYTFIRLNQTFDVAPSAQRAIVTQPNRAPATSENELEGACIEA